MEPIRAYTLAEIADSVALMLDPPHAPPIQLHEIMTLYLILPDSRILVTANATHEELTLYFKAVIPQEQRYRNLIGTALLTDRFTLWYVFTELLEERRDLLLYRSYHDAVARCNAVVRPVSARYKRRQQTEPVEHVTPDGLARLVVECGYELRVIERPHVQYFAVKTRKKGQRFQRIYLCSNKTILTMTENTLRMMLQKSGEGI